MYIKGVVCFVADIRFKCYMANVNAVTRGNNFNDTVLCLNVESTHKQVCVCFQTTCRHREDLKSVWVVYMTLRLNCQNCVVATEIRLMLLCCWSRTTMTDLSQTRFN